jgi:hypothetical protein
MTIAYTKHRLHFIKSQIDLLINDNDIIVIHSKNDKCTYQMTLEQFKSVFNNVINSNSYKVDGHYHYRKTPEKAIQFRVS